MNRNVEEIEQRVRVNADVVDQSLEVNIVSNLYSLIKFIMLYSAYT